MDRRYVKVVDALLFAALLWGASQARGENRDFIQPASASASSESNVVSKTRGLSPKIEELLGKGPAVKGPNCWNLALVSSGLVSRVRHTDSEEFKFFLQSSACRMLKNTEVRRSGDLGAIRLVSPGGFVEYHGFTFLKNDQVLTKNGVRTVDTYQVQTLDEVLDLYNVPSEEKCRGNELNLHSGCVYHLSVYRCGDRKQWLQKNQAPSWVLDFMAALSVLEAEMETLILPAAPHRPISSSTLERSNRALEKLEQHFSLRGSPKKVGARDLYFLRWAQTTMASIHEQLGSLGEGRLASRMADTESRIWDLIQDHDNLRKIQLRF